MNTWWIVKFGNELVITAYSDHKDAIGPYWSVAEVLKMLEKWR